MAEEPGKVAAYGDLAVGYWKQGKSEPMEKVLSQAKDTRLFRGLQRTDRPGAERRPFMVGRCSRSHGCLRAGKEVVSEIQEAPWKENALARIAVAQAEQGSLPTRKTPTGRLGPVHSRRCSRQNRLDSYVEAGLQVGRCTSPNGIENVFGQALAYRD